ncbi:MAG: AAA family ATPase [bacterium]|nr:AAA family ATPase [bacterium]
MKNVFVKTKNVKRLVSLLDEVQKLPPNIPKLALVYGEHGLGKTHSVIWWATRNDAIYVRANNEMTQNGLLKVIVEELGERPFFFMQENFNLVLKHLRFEPKIIVVDEVDYLVGNKNAIEVLRDIQDNTGVPIVLVGMGMMDKKIARFKHFDDRIYKKLKFEHFDENDIREILESMTELNFTDNAITYLSTRTNQFRQLVKLLEKIEKLSKTNSIDDFDEYVLKGLLNERQSIKALPKIEKVFA